MLTHYTRMAGNKSPPPIPQWQPSPTTPTGPSPNTPKLPPLPLPTPLEVVLQHHQAFLRTIPYLRNGNQGRLCHKW